MTRGRAPSARITDLATETRRYVPLVVAADWLEIDVRTLNFWIEEGRITPTPYGKFRRIAIEELKRFHGATNPGPPFHVQRTPP